MWPKAFAQLIELAPHISRLLPMADRFFQSKTGGEDATRRAIDAHRETMDAHRGSMEAISEGLRKDFGQVAAAQVGLHEELLTLTATLGSLAGDVHAAKAVAQSLEGRLIAIEGRQSRILTLFAIVLVMLTVVCILLAFFYVRGR